MAGGAGPSAAVSAIMSSRAEENKFDNGGVDNNDLVATEASTRVFNGGVLRLFRGERYGVFRLT